MKHLFLSALFALLLSACGSDPATNGQPRAEVENGTVSTVNTGGVGVGKLPAELADKAKYPLLAQRSIYFDYDRYDVRAEYKEVLSAHAKLLIKYPQTKLLIQGNTDDRGSREYNLALGQKRADAIKNMLVLFGAREEQVESVSYGKEKPRGLGSNEAAWAENRRGDIVYVGE